MEKKLRRLKMAVSIDDARGLGTRSDWYFWHCGASFADRAPPLKQGAWACGKGHCNALNDELTRCARK